MKKNSKIILICVIGILVVLLGVLGYFLFMKSSYLSKEEIKRVVIQDTCLDEKEISFKEIELDLDGETKKYDVEFYYQKVEYQYEIDAKTGDVLTTNFVKQDSSSTISNSGVDSSTQQTSVIDADQAKEVAVKDANLTIQDVVFTDVDLEEENGVTYYEVDFTYQNMEYDYKIDALTNTIISKKVEPKD